jgi:flagellar biosynthesis/type III secretory pathway protein FliH
MSESTGYSYVDDLQRYLNDLLEKARKYGYDEGYAEGHSQGYAEGYSEGQEIGRQDD